MLYILNYFIKSRFYDNTSQTIDALTFDSKKKMAKTLLDIEKKYDVIIKTLENELKETSSRVNNNVNKLSHFESKLNH